MRRVGAARIGRCAAAALVALVACGGNDRPAVDVERPRDTSDTAGPYEVRVLVEDDGEIVRAELRWFLEGERAPHPLPLEPAGDELWLGRIPGQPAGAVVRFTIEIEDDEGHLVVAQDKAADGTAVPFSFSIARRDDEG